MPRSDRFRIAVRRFDAFESAVAEQWQHWEATARTGLRLEAVAMDLPELEDALLGQQGLRNGAWDVAFLPTDWIPAVAASDAVVDLAPMLAVDAPEEYPEAWPESLLRLQRHGKAVLGLPYHDGPECLLYRTDVMKDAALQQEHAQRYGAPLRPPQTWDEFHRTARFLHGRRPGMAGAVLAGFPDGHNLVYDFLLHLWTRGGEIELAPDRLRLQQPAALEALRYYRALATDVLAVHPQSAAFDSVQAGLAFAAGEAAMAVNWFGFAALAHTADHSRARGHVSVAPIPHGEGGTSASLNVYWILSLAAGSPHRRLAWSFLRHCASPPMDLLTTQHGGIGCRRATWQHPEVLRSLPFCNQLETLHRTAREIPARQDWPQIAAILDRMMTATIATTRPVPTLLAEAQAALQARPG
ncbi:MAG: extracellular solute-binding protein [Acidobacteriota bacterium]|nr:extracellular solute-binding protein [Acidobacteriota bacterium]